MSRVLYRPHRGGLDQSMAECKVFNSAVGMLDYVAFVYNSLFSAHFSINHFSLEFYCHDDRINWDTFAICDPDGHVFGWCAFNDDAKTEWAYKKEDIS